MKTRTVSRFAAVALMALLAVGATALAVSDRGLAEADSDCPGTVLCSQSGERICKDRCPLEGEAADDCPGTIVCPLDGQTICKDRCPLGSEAAAPAPCCADEEG